MGYKEKKSGPSITPDFCVSTSVPVIFLRYRIYMSRSRAWCFTVNNYTEEDCAAVKGMQDFSVYLVCGKEVGEQGTPHLQGFVRFKNAVRFGTVKDMLKRANIRVADGDDLSNQRYCTKDGDVLIEFGQPAKQGKRNDIERVRESLQDGANMRAIVNNARSVQSVRMAEIWLKYNEPGRDWKPEVRWYWGPTGVGKTRDAREWLKDDVYTCMDTVKWFEGYDGHENVLIDDMRKDFAKFHNLLKLLDRYEYKVETKGGSRQFVAKKIAITAPYHPADMYSNQEDVNQLLRRLDKIIALGDAVRCTLDPVQFSDL